MKALVYTAPFHLEVKDLSKPRPAQDEVLIEVGACGICGSDLHGFQGKSKIRVPPMVMGHEFAGLVVSAPEASALQPGRRVVVQPLVGCGKCAYCLDGRQNICPNRQLIGAHRQGAFAEYVVAPERVVYPIADSLGDAQATLVEPLANAVHMLGLGGGALDKRVVVLGAGTLGLLTLALSRLAGARHIVVTDVDSGRLEVARRLGADETLDARDDALADHICEAFARKDDPASAREDDPRGADLIIDAAGYTAARQLGVAVASPGANLILLGLSDPTSAISILDVINREIVLRGSYSCTDADFRTAISLLERNAIETRSWMHTVSMDEGQRWFEGLVSHESSMIKVVFATSSRVKS
jgi:2-desacetyl-2-hydroxyethyl bacteriochlorophyllide A dehydrogenase